MKLPNTYNGIYEALRSASQIPERRKSLEAQKWQNGQGHGQVALIYQIGSLAIRYIACYLPF